MASLTGPPDPSRFGTVRQRVATARTAIACPGPPVAHRGLPSSVELERSPTVTSSSATAGPAVVLVHGAFAESASWSGVIARLLDRGHPVIAVANPLRGVRTDAGYLSSLIDTLDGEVVLV